MSFFGKQEGMTCFFVKLRELKSAAHPEKPTGVNEGVEAGDAGGDW